MKRLLKRVKRDLAITKSRSVTKSHRTVRNVTRVSRSPDQFTESDRLIPDSELPSGFHHENGERGETQEGFNGPAVLS